MHPLTFSTTPPTVFTLCLLYRLSVYPGILPFIPNRKLFCGQFYSSTHFTKTDLDPPDPRHSRHHGLANFDAAFDCSFVDDVSCGACGPLWLILQSVGPVAPPPHLHLLMPQPPRLTPPPRECWNCMPNCNCWMMRK